MSSGLGELTLQAHHLVSAGDLAGARQLLTDALADADPNPANATPELAEAAGLQARVLVALGEPRAARGWAAFAYAAAGRLHGRSDQRTVSAAATLAAVLHRVGSHARAARLYRDVIIELTASEGPESLRVLAAHADLATVEYARGECRVARDRLSDAWELHREVYGDGHPSGIKMLARLAVMQRDCGDGAQGRDNLALARELCRQHLPAGDPLAAQVATLAEAPARPHRACEDRPGRDEPVVPAARTPSAAESGPTRHPGYAPPPGPDAFPPHDPDDPTRHAAFPPHDLDDPTGHAFPPHDPDDLGGHTTFPPEDPDDLTGHPGHVPADRNGHRGLPPEDPADPLGHPGFAAPAGHVPNPRQPVRFPEPAAGPPRFDEDDDSWWPPERDADPAEDGNGPAVPPSVVTLAGADEADGVRRVRYLPEPAPDRRLPVHVPRPPAQRRPRRLAPVAVAGAVVVLLGAAAVVAGVSQVDEPRGEAPVAPATSGAPAGPATSGAPPATTPGEPTAAPSRSAAAAPPGAAPTGVTVRDTADGIALSWTYPPGARGPVVLSAAPTGQTPRAFQNLPAGSTSFVVYGLDRTTDYCFTVAVAHSRQLVARAAPVCTRRR